MREIGNALTIVGILVTFMAYFGQHSRVSFADLEPWVAARWRGFRAWVRKMLGRDQPATVSFNAVLRGDSSLSAEIMTWNPIQPGDDIAVRADKLARNLDSLLEQFNRTKTEHRKQLREATQKVTERLNELDQTTAQRHAESERAATSAMRWEVRGLLITLVGAGLGILG